MATVLGVIAMISFVFMIIVSFHNRGEASARMGAVGFIAFLFSLIGLILGLISIRERDSFQLFPRVGLAINLAALVGWIYIIGAGVYA